MEMAMEQGSAALDLQATMERLSAAASLLEHAVEQLGLKQVTQLSAEAEASIERIVATAEAKREAELERKLEFVEAQLETLRASRTAAAPVDSGRRTLPGTMTTLLAKQGVALDSVEAGGLDTVAGGALDKALSSLSIEQRLAVKAQLLRRGAIG